MNTHQNNELDAEELFYLSIKASQKSQHDQAIAYLKQSISLKSSGNALFLLASQYADISMFDRAIETMEQAIELAPDLWIAHLQLGMLHLVQNQPEKAKLAWKALNEIPKNNHLFLFKNGLSALIDEDIDTAKTILIQGIAENDTNPALNNSIMQILNSLEATFSTEILDKEKLEKPETLNKFFLSQYDKNR